MKKIIAYSFFILLIALSIVVIIYAVLNKNEKGQIDWSTVTSSLSVIATCIIAVTSFNLIQLQEGEYAPNVIIKLNTDRTDVYQLELCNNGKVTAYDIKIMWEKELLDSKDQSLFKSTEPIKYLLAGESIIKYIGANVPLARTRQEMYECKIEYKDKNKKRYSDKYFINLTDYNKTLFSTSEKVKAYKAIQGIEEILRRR